MHQENISPYLCLTKHYDIKAYDGMKVQLQATLYSPLKKASSRFQAPASLSIMEYPPVFDSRDGLSDL